MSENTLPSAICECPVHRCLNEAGHYRCKVCGRQLCEGCADGNDSGLCLGCVVKVQEVFREFTATLEAIEEGSD